MGNSQSGELQLAVIGNILINKHIPHTDRAFWEKLWLLPSSPEQIWDTFTLELLRNIKERKPENFATLIKLVVMQIHSIVWRARQVVSRSNALQSTVNSTVTTTTTQSTVDAATVQHIQEDTPVLLNCLRLLARLLAVLNEQPGSPFTAEYMCGLAVPGLREAYEKEKQAAIAAAKRREQEKKDQAAMKARAAEIAAERDREEAILEVKRKEQREQALKQQIELEAKAAMDRSSSSGASASAATTTNKPHLSPSTSSPTHVSTPFGAHPDQPTNTTTGQTKTDAEFASEEELQTVSATPTMQPVATPAGTTLDHEVIHHSPTAAAGTTDTTAAPAAAAPPEDDMFAGTEIRAQAVASPTTTTASKLPEAAKKPNTETKQPQLEQKAADTSIPTKPTDKSSDAKPATSTPTATAITNVLANSTADKDEPPALRPSPTPSPIPALSQSGFLRRKSKSGLPAGLDEWWYGQLFGQPLLSLIMSLITDCCFLPGFTIPPDAAAAVHHDVYLGKCWELGVGCPPKIIQAAVTSAGTRAGEHWQYDQHRVDTLRCLLAASCQSMFLPSLTASPQPDQWLQTFVSNTQPGSMTVTLAYSMLNIILSYRPETTLPYQYLSYTDYRQPLVEMCSQLLIVLLDFKAESPQENSNNRAQEPEEKAAAPHTESGDDLAQYRSDVEESDAERANKKKQRDKDWEKESEKEDKAPHQLAADSSNGKQQPQPAAKPENTAVNQESNENQHTDGSSTSTTTLPSSSTTASARTESAASTASSSSTSSPAPGARRKGSGPTVVIPNDTNVSSQSVTTHRSSDPQQQRLIEQQRSIRTTPTTAPSTTATITSSTAHTNVFYDRLFIQCDTPAELTYLYTNICRLLHHGIASNYTYLPNSAYPLTIESELFVLVWKYLDECPSFLFHIIEYCDILSLLTPLLCYVYESRKDNSKLGLMYTCVFILLKLSGEREFSVALNHTIPTPALSHLPLTSLLQINESDANYADALILVAHKLISSSPNHLDALLKVLLTLLANISPYITKLAMTSALRLLSLFELFTTPQFIYGNATNHQYALLLLDFFNNQIQYQYGGCAYLTAAIIKRARVFYALRICAEDEGYWEPMRGVGSKGHAIVFGHNTSGGSSAQTTANATPMTSTPNTPSSAAAAGVTATPAATASTGALPHAETPRPVPLSHYANAATGWVPNIEWANSWKAQLPLEPIYRLLDFIIPKLDAMQRAQPPGTPAKDETLVAYIKGNTLVGVLPIPHPIVVRRYIRNPFTNSWFTTYIWGVLFLKNQQPKLFDSKKIQLFVISKHAGERGEPSSSNTTTAAT